MIKILITFTFLVAFNTVIGSPMSSSEEVIFFPTSATITEKGLWKFPIHHWVYESEEKSIPQQLSRKIVTEILELVGLSDDDTKSENFKERIQWFLVNNKGGKNISIKISSAGLNDGTSLHSTAANGHAKTDVYLPFKKNLQDRSWIKIKTDDLTQHKRTFYGEVQLIPESGLSVISDIDDTIKISNVLDKKKLLKNVFVEPYQATKGMPALYQQLKEKGAYFHYVSSSPWQLFPNLKIFMASRYPKGTMTLRYFRLKDGSFFNFLRSSQDYKIKSISSIIKRYPKHQFILIGDSGEHDPEIYANIYQQFPNNIQSIWIRPVEGSDVSKERFNVSFKSVPRGIWSIFDSP